MDELTVGSDGALVFFPLWNESVKRQHPSALDKYFSNVTMLYDTFIRCK